MKSKQLNERYAKALLQLSVEQECLEAVYADMQMIRQLLHDSRELKLLMHSPVIRNKKKEHVIAKIFGSAIHELTLKFILLVVDKNREIYLEDISETFEVLYREHIGVVPVTVVAAAEVDSESEVAITQILRDYTEREIEFHTEIDESLLGGFILKWEDNQYDATLRRKLTQIRKILAEETIYKKKV